MSEANPTLDPIGYRCDGCGRLFRDPYADLSAIRAAGGRSCCPERKPVGLSDRIEELESELSLRTNLHEECIYLLKSTEANLAKAVEALSAIEGWTNNPEIEEFARTTLAELTGDKDE